MCHLHHREDLRSKIRAEAVITGFVGRLKVPDFLALDHVDATDPLAGSRSTKCLNIAWTVPMRYR